MRKKTKAIVQKVKITGMADRGRSVGRAENGQVIFVENVVPGDVVDVLVLKDRKGFKEGIANHFHSYSEDRQQAFCQHFGVCGGCKWQNLAYQTQLKHKEIVVSDAMKRIGKVQIGEILPIVPAIETEYYRNKLEFTFSNKKWLTKDEIARGVLNYKNVLGFHRPRAFDKIVEINHCYLQPEPSNELRNTIRDIGIEMDLDFLDLNAKDGFLRHLLLRITSLGQIMLIVSFFKEDKVKRIAFLDEILKRFPQITSLHYCINSKENDFILDLDIFNYYGKGFVEESLGDVKFRIGPKSFFQTNTKQAVCLFDKVVEFADLTGNENVYDLYTGIGSIALYIAKYCRQVVGIEEVDSAIEDAKENSKLNGFDNTVFYTGDVRNILTPKFSKKHGKPDLVITDPPRAGMHADVVKLLLLLEAPKIVYVSCNPATQARDFNLLSDKYEIVKLQPVDMFPHTHHVETVALLQLKPKKGVENWLNWLELSKK